jgi:APA family basic amino acid/polyamine antiporter
VLTTLRRLASRTKPLDVLMREAHHEEAGDAAAAPDGQHHLRRVLGPVGLISMGVGSIIGTGIFVLIGEVVRDKTGPAVMVSFLVAAVACVFAGLCYAEFASMVPVAGSAYTYAYATLGELMAWIIGWDLVLEYAVSASTIAASWSGYFNELLKLLTGGRLPEAISTAAVVYNSTLGDYERTAGVVNLPAVAITLLLTGILVVGIRESARFNTAMVLVKVTVLIFVIAVGAFYVDPRNWHPFASYGWGGVGFFGHTLFGQHDPGGKPVGMLAGAAIIFFAYIGFDSVSTQAEEAKNPRRDLPLGIIGSLVICTVLYVAVSAVLTGMLPYRELSKDAPLSHAFERKGLRWAEAFITLGALTGLTSVLLVTMLGQARILMAMARDGLLPRRVFGAIHPRFRTPWVATMVTGAFVCLPAAFLPVDVLADLVSIGTLFAFTVVCAAVLIMRRTNPGLPRPFRAPLVPLVPVLGIGICLLLMCSLAWQNWLRLLGWLALGLVIYFAYGRRHSRLTSGS